MAELLSPQQRPVCTIGEVPQPAETSIRRTEAAKAASPKIPHRDENENVGKREGQSNFTPEARCESALHAMTIVAQDGRAKEEKDSGTPAKGTPESREEPNLQIPARQKAILTRVLRHWKRKTRKDAQKSTPSEN